MLAGEFMHDIEILTQKPTPTAKKSIAVHGESRISVSPIKLTLPSGGHRSFSPVLAVQRVRASMPGSTVPFGNFTLRWSGDGRSYTVTSRIASNAPAQIANEKDEGFAAGESMQAKLQAM